MTPDELTGAYVREVRERHKLSRKDFCELLGWPTQTRLGNIEVKDSWKAGNRDEVYAVLDRLENGEMPDPITPQDREDAARAAVGDPDTDDDRAESTFRAVDATELYDAADVDWDAAFVTEELQEVMPSPTYEPLPPVDHTFSNGEFETWRRCRRKWWLAWYRKLAPRTNDWAGPRAIGDRVHRALAMWYVPEGQPRTDPRDALERVITEDWTKVVEESRKRNTDEMWLADVAKRFTNATALERVMIEGYVQWLGETGADSELEIIGAEQVLTADLEVDMGQSTFSWNETGDFTVNVKPPTRPIRLVGRLDARAHRKSDGVVVFIDHKTTGDLLGVQATLHGNPQMLTYHVLEWLNTLEGERHADGALYNMLKKNKRTTQAKPPFFDRVEVQHNVHELETWTAELLGAARDILAIEDALNAGENHLRVVYRTWNDTCKWGCDFFAICPMFNDGSRVEDAITGLFHEVDPHDRYDSREVAEAVRASIGPQESRS